MNGRQACACRSSSVRGHQAQRLVGQLARHEAAVGQVAEPDREVVAFGDEVDAAVRDVQFHLHVRIPPREARQQGGYAVVTPCRRDTHADPSRECPCLPLDLALRVAQQREGRTGLLQVVAAGFRQRDAARRPSQQLRAEAVFQPRHRAAQHGRRRRQRDRPRRERFTVRHGQERFQVVQVVELSADFVLQRTNRAGNLWITDVTRNGIVRYDPHTGTLALQAASDGVHWPDTPAIGPDGDIVFTASHLNGHFAGQVKAGEENESSRT